MNNEVLLEQLLSKLEKKVSLMSYNTMLKDIQIYSYIGNEVTITINSDNELLLQTIENGYSSTIEEIINDLTNDSCIIKYVQKRELQAKKEAEEKINIIQKNNSNLIDSDITNYKYNSNFNPKYTFDTFIVGESNKLAYGTALAVAQNPGKLYNPYFIYAKSGLGKTHLMHAIGNYIVNNSDKKVLYISAEQFINDYKSIMSIKDKNENNMSYLEAFREKYRNVDVLMIDDIQFLEKKVKTQIEFTNTFNTLHNNEKQIVIASDTAIDDYKYLEERLKTRFKWGLTESINTPDIELKKNIIRNKIIIYDFDLDLNDEIINYIASNCGSNIRNLEGSLKRLHAYKTMFKINEFTLSIAKEALTEFVEETIYNTNSIPKILEVVAKFYGIDVSMIKGKMKKQKIANARSIAMYLSRALTDESLERIGLEIGGRDHSTVIHHYEKVSKELTKNIKLQEEIKILKQKICE